ncbi:HdeD family acid-resistance protein [Nonomuraea sp. NBC_01738]|uniref:HdeD family acid-resistance protein n=1 Tax=Nonomuraea sp. NBC_01738 TaxID=2976003 RepID=UPI002E168904|nr:HdeD family acid-resistance protein [Nonomuraea sp. NBC_01738]
MQEIARTWWLVLIRGICAIIFGILALFWPGITVYVLVIFFAAYAIVGGSFSLFAAFGHNVQSRAWLIISGIIGILAGIVAFVWPGITAVALLYIIAIWAIFTGIAEIVAGIAVRKQIDNEWIIIVAGVISVIFGFLLLIWPASGMLALTWLLGIFALIYGIAMIVLSFRVKKLAL